MVPVFVSGKKNRFYSSTVHSSETMESTKIFNFIIRWANIENEGNKHNGILFSHEKELNPVICTRKGGTGGHDVEWNKSSKERQILYVVPYIGARTV